MAQKGRSNKSQSQGGKAGNENRSKQKRYGQKSFDRKRNSGDEKRREGKGQGQKYERVKSGENDAIRNQRREAYLGYRPLEIPHEKETGVKVPCPYFNDCGGCQLLDVSYEKSLNLKQKAIEKLMKDFGEVKPIIGMRNPFHYRNKSVASLGREGKDQYFAGMYKSNSRDLVKIESCLIQDERADAIVETIRSLMKSFKMTSYNEHSGYGWLRHILIRIGQKTDEIMVVMVTTSVMFQGKNNFIKVLKKKHPEITTLVMNVNDKDTSRVLGNRDINLYGPGFIKDELCGLKFRISPQSFYQINPVQTEVLYNTAMEMAKLSGTETVLDAYCGIGTIGLIAASNAKEVMGVELNEEAVRDAIGNAKGNKINNIRFYTGDAGDFMVAMASEGHELDLVFMDPPRSGVSKEFIKAIGISKPRRLVYVSCGPESLERDLKWLEKEGYQVQEIQPVDMFPWTNHVETVLSMVKK